MLTLTITHRCSPLFSLGSLCRPWLLRFPLTALSSWPAFPASFALTAPSAWPLFPCSVLTADAAWQPAFFKPAFFVVLCKPFRIILLHPLIPVSGGFRYLSFFSRFLLNSWWVSCLWKLVFSSNGIATALTVRQDSWAKAKKNWTDF